MRQTVAWTLKANESEKLTKIAVENLARINLLKVGRRWLSGGDGNAYHVANN